MEMKEYIREFTLKDIVTVRNPKVVALGGGTGLSVILRGLKKYTNRLTAIVTVGDDGGSSGMLRQDLGILPPGDIRNCILALADDENVMQSLFNYRFTEGGLEGHNFGNLFLAAMNGISNDFYDAVRRTSDVLQIKGRVLPVTLDDMTLNATLDNGETVVGESQIPKAVCEKSCRIKKIFLKPDKIEPLEETLEAIKVADIVIIGPGSLYTSVIPNLLVGGIESAIKENRGRKFYVGNIMTQPGETDGYTQYDHVRAIEAHQKIKERRLFQYCVFNSGDLPDYVARQYEKYNSEKVAIGEMLPEYQYVTDDFIIVENGRIRHDADLLARRIFEAYVNSK
ncbi:gluconeogenesis factor YvcK family protein [Eubacterium sp. 1001713B170207_170306_E7]|uniref:gluconeogenesis factor YvcK family protein n=1 Tax=Eubacterium sp. 1001713B170207_170306_E7 TaxID=2787097 RepID=UPI001897DBD8|nr:gluconeogenesis factor YvcK family protein [Eubacterium sp. 1001713B170207_170306_E7]